MSEITFEQSVARLNEIVAQLEKGDAPLDELLFLFEEGTKLIRACDARLNDAEKKITQLVRNADGTTQEVPFDPEG